MTQRPSLHSAWENALPDDECGNGFHRGELLKAERGKTRKRLERAVTVAGSIPEDSLLFSENAKDVDWDKQDNHERWEQMIEQALDLTEHIAPITAKNWHLHAHLRRSAQMARAITEKLNAEKIVHLNPYEMEVRGLFHDFGRLIGQQAYLRTEYEGDAALNRMSLERFVVDTVRVGRRFRPLEHLSDIEKIVTLADMTGGVDFKGGLSSIMPFEEKIKKHEETRNTLESYIRYNRKVSEEKRIPVFPSEIAGLLWMERGDKDRYTKLYRMLERKMRMAWNVDIRAIREEILENEKAGLSTPMIRIQKALKEKGANS